MATAKKEQIGIEMLVSPRIDPRATAKIIKEVSDVQKKLTKQLSKVKVDFSQVAKQSSASIGHIKDITAATSAFSKQLSQGAKAWAKDLGDLGDQLEEAHEKAFQFERQLSKARTPAARREAATGLGATQKQIIGLNKQISEYRKTGHRYNFELKKTVKSQMAARRAMEEMASYTGAHFAKDLLGSIKGIAGGVHGVKAAGAGIVTAAGKRYAARKVESAEMAGGPMAAEAMAKAMGRIAGAAAVLATMVKLIIAAVDHMADLNKAMLEGSTLAGDSALSAAKYAKTMKDLRDSAIGLTGSWLKFGVTSKEGLQAIAVFSKETSGSLAQTEARIKGMGDGFADPLKAGMDSFVTAAKVYGTALGMSVTDTAELMGTLVNEIGVASDNVQATLGDLVHQASASNIPIYKFMDMFRSALPSLDLYINRIEELTGTMKLLGQAMSPRSIKQFMDAFRQGFDQMDFKQRLKIGLVAGIGNVNEILQRNFQSAGKGLANAMGKKFGPQFEKAMKDADPVKAVRKVAARALASGEVSGASIEAAQKLARSERLRKRGGALNIAGAMRGAGLMARMEILEKAAGSLTGGNIEGLGEHVAKQITGMSEQQYQGILQLQDAMGNYMGQLEDVGRTSNKDINKNLLHLLQQDKSLGIKSDKDMEAYMKKLSVTDRKKAEKYVKEAAVMQIESDSKAQGDVKDLAAEQVDATLGVSGKIENVVGYLLEKLYWLLNEVYGWLGSDLWNWLTGGSDDAKDVAKYSEESAKDIRKIHGDQSTATDYFRDFSKQVQDLANSGADTTSILNQMGGHISDIQSDPKAIKDMSVFFKTWGTFGRDVSGEFQDLMGKGGKRTAQEQVRLDELLKGMNKKDLLKMLTVIGMKEAGKATGEKKLGRGEEKLAERKTKTEKELAEARADLDQRTKWLYEHPEDVGKSDDELAKKMAAAGVKAETEQPTAPEPVKPTSAEGQALDAAQQATEATEGSGDQISDTIGDHAEKALRQDKLTYKGVTNVFDLLKQGVKFHPGFLTGPYQNTIKDATYSSFEKALIGFAILQNKLALHPEFQKSLDEMGWQTLEAGAGLKDLSHLPQEAMKTGNDLKDWLDKNKAGQESEGGRQMGGPIPDTGMYKLHKGETVLDPMTYGAVQRGLRDGGGGGGPVTVNVTAAPNWSQQQFENAVVNVMSRVQRKP